MKKIAVNTLKAFLKEHKREDLYTETFTLGDSSFDVTYHTALTVDEKSVFINRVVSGCFDSAGRFRPEYVHPMIRATIIQMCTNIPPLTLKGETDEDGAAVLDLDGMNELYLSMNLDTVQNDGYQIMLQEMTYLCSQAIEWRKNSIVSSLSNALDQIAQKIERTDMGQLLQYAGDLSKATKDLDEGGILNGLIRLYEEKKE